MAQIMREKHVSYIRDRRVQDDDEVQDDDDKQGRVPHVCLML